MALTRPILNNIVNFDATKSYDFTYSIYGGDQVLRTNISIYNNSTNTEVYNVTNESFQFKYTLPVNSLNNLLQYKIRIRTGNVNNEWSDWSDWKLFSCFQLADVTITNLQNSIANNQNYVFEGSYTGYGDVLSSYLFILYDENGVQLDTSPLSYSSTISASFILQNQTNYKIELKCLSQSGVTISSGLIPFKAIYLAPIMGAELDLKNLSEQGAIDISIIAVDRVAKAYNYTFVDSDWIDLTNNSLLSLEEGLNTIDNNFSIKMYIKNIPVDTTFLKIISEYGDISISHYDGHIHAWQISCGLKSHFINSDVILVNPDDIVCIEVKYVNGLVDIFAENMTESSYSANTISNYTWNDLNQINWDDI